MSDLPDLGFDELMRPLRRFRAKGRTWQHREDFTSWGWHWNPQERCWKTGADDASDVCVCAVARLEGVLVEEVQEEPKP